MKNHPNLFKNFILIGLLGCVLNSNAGKLEDIILKQEGVESRINRTTRSRVSRNNIPENYAFIVSSDEKKREALSTFYQTLLEHGYSYRDIFILDGSSETLVYPSNGRANKENIDRVLMHLRKTMGPEDKLLLYLDSESFVEEGKRKFRIGKDQLDLELLRSRISNTSYGSATIMLDRCHDEETVQEIATDKSLSRDLSIIYLRNEENGSILDLIRTLRYIQRGYNQRSRYPEIDRGIELYEKLQKNSESPFGIFPKGSLKRKKLN